MGVKTSVSYYQEKKRAHHHSKWFRQNTDIYIVWQRNYYEHIIRNEIELNKIREYIINNPLQWESDKYFNL